MTQADATVLRLEGELNIYRAAELKDEILRAVEGAAALEIDLSAIEEIDTAGVQLLMLAKRHAQGMRHELRLAEHSAAVLEVLGTLNLAAFFGDPLVVPARRA